MAVPMAPAIAVVPTLLVSKTRGVDQQLVVDSTGKTVAVLTQAEYAALGLKGAGAPPGISKADWESGTVIACAGIPDYGGGQKQLNHGEYEETSEIFNIGMQRKDGSLTIVGLLKADITWSKTLGLLSITTTWPAHSEVASVTDGILTMKV